MTITYTQETDTIVLASDEFASLASGTLESTINCGDTEYKITGILQADVAGGTYTVNISTLYGLSELADGIYSFKMTILKADTTTVVKRNCLLVNKKMTCAVTKLVAEHQDKALLELHNLLINATNCECICDPLCTIYNKIISYEPDGCANC
jgi:hypothetical protein